MARFMGYTPISPDERKLFVISMLTLNVRIQTVLDGSNQFAHRKDRMIRRLMEESPDVIGFQEVLGGMLGPIRQGMAGYGFIGLPSKRNGRGEYTAIAYRQNAVELVDSGVFWLSGQPEKAGSRFFLQSMDPRSCTWAEFKDLASGTRFRYFNTHLDHLSPLARARGARVIFRHIAQLQRRERLPIFWGGDFNFTPMAGLYSECLRQVIGEERLTDVTDAIPSTFHWFGAMKRPMKLDYIFVDEKTAGDAMEVELLRTDEGSGCISDHHGIRLNWHPGEPGREPEKAALLEAYSGSAVPAV